MRASAHNVLLGPTLDLARDPRGGRVPEGFGEEPYLTGLIAAAHVHGVQSNHVMSQLKHYIGLQLREPAHRVGARVANAATLLTSMSHAQRSPMSTCARCRAAVEAARGR